MLAARELGLDGLWEESAAWLREQRDADGVWEQNLYGSSTAILGPAHGWAGCVLALGEGMGVAEVAWRFAVEEDGLANWPPVAGVDLVSSNRDGSIRTQWCHGAPGMVASLAGFLDEELALAGGELTWQAGPLVKGANLCHGTAGNGYALLALFTRTGDERWLDRARAFAMHALGQVERARSTTGQGRGCRGPAIRNGPLPGGLSRRQVEAPTSLAARQHGREALGVTPRRATDNGGTDGDHEKLRSTPTAGPSEWFTGTVYIDAVASAVGCASRVEREQRPLHSGCTNGLAHPSERPDDLCHRGHRPRATAWRAGRGDSAG